MATMAIMTRLKSLAANLHTKVNNGLLSRPLATPSSSSSFSKIEEEVGKLCRIMKWIRAVLCDAEEREITENHIKLWLNELRDVAYDAEDAVEEFEYELLRYQLTCEEGEDGQTIHGEHENDHIAHEASNSHATPPHPLLHDASFQQQIIAKIKDINNRFDEIYKHRCALKLSKKDGPKHKKPKVVQRAQTSSLLGDSHVYGRDADKKAAMDMLLSSESHEHDAKNVSVVSIVGMGGIGKTTLAQLIYNDNRVQDHFEVKLWVCVSDRFDVLRLTQEVLEKLVGGTIRLRAFDPLQERLHDHLKGKRFLLVLDDLWNESLGQWEALWKPLSSGAEGSKILVTSRNEQVSRIAGAISMHRLKGLPADNCWSSFAQFAFRCKNPDEHPRLASIGKEIVQKCGGMPLAIKTLGGLLFNNIDEDRWNGILKSDIWELPEEKNDILPALKLSYHHLPSPIKPCFAFCAVFPKGSCLKSKDLVSFWMAQGYIKPTRGRCMEDIGQEYFEALLQRSFFEDLGCAIGFKMRDLIHDLALAVCEGGCFNVKDGELPSTLRRVRHLPSECEEDTMPLLSCGSTDGFRYWRTSHSHCSYRQRNFCLKFLNNMLPSMKYLRVLDLRYMTTLRELPDSIGKLKHLRYLGVWLNGSGRFPESLCDLLNLQTLYCRGVHVRELPKRLKDLVNLRHHDLELDHLSMMPRGIGRLTQLRTLRRFVVGNEICAAGIGELRHLNDLQGELEINVKSLSDWVNREANILSGKKGLELLVLNFDDPEETCSDESLSTSMRQQQEELLELIQPHTNIRHLHISCYLGSGLPKWMGDPSYSRLQTLSLRDCWNCRHLPALGQLSSLKSLAVCDMYEVTSVGSEFLGDGRAVNGASAFLSLEVLSFGNMSKLEELLLIGTEDGDAFPRLRVLEVQNCCELRYVKLRHLSALETLHIRACHKLTMLDCYHVMTVSHSGLQQEVVHYMHIPHIHTMRLECCPKLLNFLPSAHQRLPPSLSWLSVAGSPLLMEWVRGHKHELLGITYLHIDGYFICRQNAKKLEYCTRSS